MNGINRENDDLRERADELPSAAIQEEEEEYLAVFFRVVQEDFTPEK